MSTPSATSSKVPVSAPSSASIADLVEAGTRALNEGDLRTALERFEEVVLAHPDRPEGHNNLGALYSAIGEYAKAETCFDRVLELIPGNANLQYNRGVARARQEKFDRAREDFAAALASQPDDPDLHNNLGVISFLQGRFPEARLHLQAALAGATDKVNVVLNLCDLELAEGNRAAALVHCEEFLARHHSLEIRRRQLDLLSTGCREALDEAGRVAERLLSRDAENTEVRTELKRLTRARTALAEAAV